MAMKRGQRKLIRARKWPRSLSEKKLAEFVATHDLSELIGGGRSAKVDFTQKALEQTKSKREGRLLVALRLGKGDLERIKQIARERDIPYTALMRSWIRAGLRREGRRAG